MSSPGPPPALLPVDDSRSSPRHPPGLLVVDDSRLSPEHGPDVLPDYLKHHTLDPNWDYEDLPSPCVDGEPANFPKLPPFMSLDPHVVVRIVDSINENGKRIISLLEEQTAVASTKLDVYKEEVEFSIAHRRRMYSLASLESKCKVEIHEADMRLKDLQQQHMVRQLGMENQQNLK